MGIAEGWDERFSSQVGHLLRRVLLRQFVSHKDDPSLILHQILRDVIRLIYGKYISFVDFHS